MGLYVSFPILFSVELFVAYVTHVFICSHMYIQVIRQAARMSIFFIANLAVVSSPSCVSLQVVRQGVPMSIFLSTNPTLVRFLSRVYPYVCFKSIYSHELETALRA